MTQIVMLDTVVGPKPLRAPEGWVFDKTAVHVWAALISETRRKPKLARDRHARALICNVLGNVLANSLGMASFYWTQEAEKIVKGKSDGD